ncbi:DEAD/DEAH box helicase [Ornithinimicrobium sp. INDO-MA30-4]|uniref:DEAD/DEAH box helicase n=1 Tax=Ornithinimicrobium sp. INDO-MA30-4 TaxID=2908651 RepID=UPI001F2E07A9|nr:helicase-related protein [Ornithinimicrobium sp. INDO-MA30-4]UJH69527.1 hypothetical protein L0A91_09075 [Ornithinimicrobium sp. INDO-MA30-4]
MPAPIFRMTADLQARRRLGLTATLVREDGRESDVFSLIGPKRFDAPWKDIEAQGYIAPADCVEVRVSLPDALRMAYAVAEPEERYRFASTAAVKDGVVAELVKKHQGEQTLVIGQYLDQLDKLAESLGAPMITGATTVAERQKLFQEFRTGEISLLVVSRSPTSRLTCQKPRWPSRSRALWLPPGGSTALGTRASPQGDGRTAHFYTIVARDTVDSEFAAHRQRFLAEQGYAYRIIDADDLDTLKPGASCSSPAGCERLR